MRRGSAQGPSSSVLGRVGARRVGVRAGRDDGAFDSTGVAAGGAAGTDDDVAAAVRGSSSASITAVALAVAVADERIAASALAAALARSAVSMGSMPLEIGIAVAAVARVSSPGLRPLETSSGSASADGPARRNTGSTSVPGCGT
jgi:hypothetical protein